MPDTRACDEEEKTRGQEMIRAVSSATIRAYLLEGSRA